MTRLEERAGHGWGRPLNARKYHYFDGGRSLCGRWLFFGDCQAADPNDAAPYATDCKTCFRRLQERQARKDSQ